MSEWVTIELLALIAGVVLIIVVARAFGLIAGQMDMLSVFTDDTGCVEIPDLEQGATREQFLEVLDYYDFTVREQLLVILDFLGERKGDFNLEVLWENISDDRYTSHFCIDVAVEAMLLKWEGPIAVIYDEYAVARGQREPTDPDLLVREIIYSHARYYPMEM